MGLANKDILLSKTTRPLIFCATHQLENFIKQGYRAEEAARELESRRTWRAADVCHECGETETIDPYNDGVPVCVFCGTRR